MCKCSGKCGCNITSTTKGEKGDASPVSNLGYKVYSALISQSGTSIPTANVFQNTLGATISFTRSAIGVYVATFSSDPTTDSAKILVVVSANSLGVLTQTAKTTSTVGFRSYNYSAALSDDILANNFLEIRVYP
jgi:hypothetical protein